MYIAITALLGITYNNPDPTHACPRREREPIIAAAVAASTYSCSISKH